MQTTKASSLLASLLLFSGCFSPNPSQSVATGADETETGGEDDSASAGEAGDASGGPGGEEGGTPGTSGDDSGESGEESGEESGDETGGTDGEPACGDGVVDGDETCDDGNGIDGDGCNNDCAPSGQLLWTELGGDAARFPTDVAIDSASQIIALGISFSDPTWLERYDADGELIDTANPAPGTVHIAVLDNDDIVTCGSVEGEGVYAGMLGPMFNEIFWEVSAPDPGAAVSVWCGGVEALPNGDFALLGYLAGDAYNSVAFTYGITTAPEIDWLQIYNPVADLGVREIGWDVAIAGDGRVAVVGATDMDPTAGTDNHAWIEVYDEGGEPIWGDTYGELDDDQPLFVSATWDDENDRIVVLGSEGDELLVRTYAGDGNGAHNTFFDNESGSANVPGAVELDANGHILLLASEDRADLGEDWNVRLRKLDTELNVLWERSYNGADDGSDSARSMAVDPNDNAIVVLGREDVEGTFLLKFSQ